jgi:hypothetical protein
MGIQWSTTEIRELELEVELSSGEPREWECNGVQWGTRSGNSHRKLVVEEN